MVWTATCNAWLVPHRSGGPGGGSNFDADGSKGLGGNRDHPDQTGSETPRTSRRLCGSLAFTARIRRARSTVASRLVRKAR
jgi:hypothetical protein